jgi:ParB family transcriptional regulator, chromosome partitioning protein
MINSQDNRKSSLGRGLSSLMPQNPLDEKKEGFRYVQLSKITPNPYQPRQNIPLASISELAESIKEKGLIQPLTVVPSKVHDDEYIIVAGERRFQASKLAGFDEVPVVVKELSEQDMAELAIIENIHRKDLNPIEEGCAFMRLSTEFGLTFDQIANKLSKTRSYVENKTRLTKLPHIIQNAIAVGEITENHGRALFSLSDEEAMVAALKIVIRNGLNAQRTEELVRQIKSESVTDKKSLRANPTIAWEARYNYIKQDLNDGMGLDVKLKRNRKDGGAIMIHFTNDDELVSIYRKLTGKED